MLSCPLRWLFGCALATILFGGLRLARAEDKTGPVIVHEWGTFTCLQDEMGHAIGGINVDDEPVPSFVWNVGGASVAAQYSHDFHNFGLPPYRDGKGWAAADPGVTMRLETPVLYLYPPKGRTPESVPPLDVHVDFHGGVLSQFYPYARANGVSFNGDTPYVRDGLTAQTTTGLTWKDVRLGSTGTPVETDDKVWTTPREVDAPLLEIATHFKDAQGVEEPKLNEVQTEHFLFYRGVGHLDSQLYAHRAHEESKRMRIGAITNPEVDFDYQTWMVEVRHGLCAFRCVKERAGAFSMGIPFQPEISSSFSDNDFSAGNLAGLEASMHEALVKEGLYPDEATAMLKTWELSYFKSTGLRFFYIVSKAWVDKVLSLKITGAPTNITRVMVGRIELVTDDQREALHRLAAGPCPDLGAVKSAAQDALQNGKLSQDEVEAFYRGEKPLTDLGIAIPPLIRDYLSLGRFRDALVLNEYRKKPTPALARFIKDNGLAPGSLTSIRVSSPLLTR
jgi:hypothetical protein